MRTLLAICFLLLPSILLWIKWYHEYTEKLLESVERLICFLLLTSYFAVILVYGAETLEGIDKRILSPGHSRSFFWFYVYPGIGFGMIMFPKVAAEFTRHYLPLARANLLSLFSVFGWLILAASALLSTIYRE